MTPTAPPPMQGVKMVSRRSLGIIFFGAIGVVGIAVLLNFWLSLDTSLHTAARRADLTSARYLIALGANINAKEPVYGETPLHGPMHGVHCTWRQGEEEYLPVVNLLIQKGADVNAQDNTGRTPLHEALLHGCTMAARLLIAVGADVTLRDRYGTSSVDYASYRCDVPIIELLVYKGADLYARDHSGRSALFSAAIDGNYTVAQFLISRGLNVTDVDERGRTPLHATAMSTAPDWQFAERLKQTAELFISHGADINAKSKAGQTPLALALAKQPALAEFLRSRGGHE
jgi:ankyrin repeat protein